MFWVSGSLPTATKTQSKLSLSPSEKLTFLSVIDSTDVLNLKFTPLLDSCFLNSPDVLLSKPGNISLASSTTTTSESKSFKRLANSQPIAPAPITQTFFGGFSQFNAVSEVIVNSSSISILGRDLGFEPVARSIKSDSITISSPSAFLTRTLFLSFIEPQPSITFTFFELSNMPIPPTSLLTISYLFSAVLAQLIDFSLTSIPNSLEVSIS